MIGEIDQLLEETLDGLLLSTQVTYPAFHEAYRVTRQVLDLRGPRRKKKEAGVEDTPTVPASGETSTTPAEQSRAA